VRLTVEPELELFAESIRGALAGWEPPREPAFGEWWDERDDALAARLTSVGWARLWEAELLPAAVAGALELGRAVAPVCLVDDATLGGPLAVGDRVRHGGGARRAVAPTREGLRVLGLADERPETTLDGSGTLRATLLEQATTPGAAHLRTWCAAMLGYLAGLAAGALDGAVGHARSREQFGAPLTALPTMQARLADAKLLVDGVELLAWEAGSPQDGEPPLREAALLHATSAARDVTASAHQVYGGVGFALETGVHRAYRRAKALQAWTTAVIRESA
jgi:hypothetical protein